MKQEPILTTSTAESLAMPPTDLERAPADSGDNNLAATGSAGRAVAFIRANWHKDIVDRAREGFLAELEELQATHMHVDIYDVPGAYEIPLLAKRLAQTGQYNAIVGAAFVVNGGIYHHEFVSDTVVSHLMQAQMQTEVPMFSVILTPHNFQETEPHEEFFKTHFVLKGREAARAVTSMLHLYGQLDQNLLVAAGKGNHSRP